MKIALLQMNPTVGDLAGNARLIARRAARGGVGRRRSRRHARARARRLSAARPAAQPGLRRGGAGTAVERARPRRRRSAAGARRPAGAEPVGRRAARSSTAPCCCGTAASTQRFRKALLPTYDVFDEDRYFEPFHGPQVLDIGGRRLGISICEDIWNDRDFWKRRRYHHDPIEELVRAGADVDRQPVGVAVHRRQAPPPRGDAEQHGAQASRADRLRQSVRRQRRPGLRRPQLRVRRRRRRRSRAAARSTPTSSSATSTRARPIAPAGGSRRRIRDLARARPRHARLRAQMRLLARSCSASPAASTRR